MGLQQRRDMCKKKKAMRSSGNINSKVDQKANIRLLMQFRKWTDGEDIKK